MKNPPIAILTGAGISAESGVPTFRDANGLWEGHRIEEVATPEAFERNPGLVRHFYNLRRAALASVEPNPAHVALARLQREYPGRVTVVTQNVDDLHERAGSTEVIHMHGELLKALCVACRVSQPWSGDMDAECVCACCRKRGTLRPDIVWFGEIPYRMDEIESALFAAWIFASIGTSGQVYPAAGFVMTAKYGGAKTVEINTMVTSISGQFSERRIGKASVEVTKWVDELLAE